MLCTREAGVEADISDKKKDRLKQVKTFKYRDIEWELDVEVARNVRNSM